MRIIRHVPRNDQGCNAMKKSNCDHTVCAIHRLLFGQGINKTLEYFCTFSVFTLLQTD